MSVVGILASPHEVRGNRFGVRQFYPRIVGDTLKQQCLFFDQIVVPDLPKILDWLYKKDLAILSDLDWLQDHGVIRSVDTQTLFGGEEDYEPVYIVEPIGASMALEAAVFQFKADLDCREICAELAKTSPSYVPILPNGFKDLAHLFENEAALARAEKFSHYTHYRSSDQIGEPGDVVSVIIKTLPQPDELTSWEDILEFRRDEDSVQKMLSLRRWMRKAASEFHSRQELSEELQWMLQGYENHMKLHRMKVNQGALETVITVTAKFAEDFVKFKWGELAKAPFVLKHRRVELLEAEAAAPGREIGYISKAAHAFK